MNEYMVKDRNWVKNEVVKFVESGYPIIYLYTFEELKTLNVLEEAAKEIDVLSIFTYDLAQGLMCFYSSDSIKKKRYDKNFEISQRISLDEVQNYIFKNVSEKAFFIFKDAQMIFKADNSNVRIFKNIIFQGIRESRFFSFHLISPELAIPQEISKEVALIDVPLPSRKEINAILQKFIERFNIYLTEPLKMKFIDALNGLNENELSRLINLCLQDDGTIDENDIETIISHKRQIVRKSGLLELHQGRESFDSIGGLYNLKNWLKKKKKIFDDIETANQWGVDIPKGVLLVGMPGCGKSMSAKAASTLFRVPLLRMDMGMVLGPYLGQSEENIRRAIKMAESISPCILWIDEMEKVFSGAAKNGGQHETSIRIFGHILTWMQEKTRPVFVIATANDIGSMPPELLRKGRFDEVFFVDFPGTDEVKEILEKHLEKRLKRRKDSKSLMEKIDIDKIANQIKNYSGADIESVVKEIIEEKFVNEKDNSLNTDDFLKKLKNFKPISKSLHKKIEEIRAKQKEFDLTPGN